MRKRHASENKLNEREVEGVCKDSKRFYRKINSKQGTKTVEAQIRNKDREITTNGT